MKFPLYFGPSDPGTDENQCYPPNAVENIRRAMKYLQERIGAQRFILVGLCSGGDLPFKVGFQERAVVGAVIMNPRTFCVHDLKMVEMIDRAHYFQDAFAKREKWQKLLRGEVDVFGATRNLIPVITSWFQNKFRDNYKDRLQDGFQEELQRDQNTAMRLV